MPVSSLVKSVIVEIATGAMILQCTMVVPTNVLGTQHRSVEDGTRIMCMRQENDVCISLNNHY